MSTKSSPKHFYVSGCDRPPEEQECQRADRAEAQLLQTARNLLTAGMTVEEVARITGLDVAVIEQLISTSEA